MFRIHARIVLLTVGAREGMVSFVFSCLLLFLGCWCSSKRKDVYLRDFKSAACVMKCFRTSNCSPLPSVSLCWLCHGNLGGKLLDSCLRPGCVDVGWRRGMASSAIAYPAVTMKVGEKNGELCHFACVCVLCFGVVKKKCFFLCHSTSMFGICFSRREKRVVRSLISRSCPVCLRMGHSVGIFSFVISFSCSRCVHEC